MAPRLALASALTAALILTCSCSPLGSLLPQATAIPPTARPSPTSRPSATLTATRPAPATETRVPTMIPAAPLSPEGPWSWWLVFVDGSALPFGGAELWAVNPDGSGLTLLADQLIGMNDPLAQAVPLGHPYVAYVTGRDGYHDLTLNIVTLPSGEVLASIPLTSPETEPREEDLANRTPRAEALEAIRYSDGIAWSLDGLRLAFAGVIDGPSSDVYVYSLEDGSITRLTDGPSQVAHLSWSPDGQYIFHVGVETFGVGAGYGLAGVWAVRADGGGVRSLYDPGDSGDEVPVGWDGDETVVVHSWDAENGASNLRSVNVRTGAVEPLFPDSFWNVVWARNSVLVTNPLGVQSMLLISRWDAYWLPFPGYDASSAAWAEPADQFFVRTEGELEEVVGLFRNGTLTLLAAPTGSEGVPTAGGVTGPMLAWSGEGIWIGSRRDPQTQARQIFSDPAYLPQWGPEAEHLLFFASDGLYTAAAPDYIPARVGSATASQEGGVSWVWSWR